MSPAPTVTFWTDAPDDAPEEIKGYTCCFRPERLEWSVSLDPHGRSRVYVIAHGPATRVECRQGSYGWVVEGRPWGDERPPWLLLPVDSLMTANLAVDSIARKAGR